MYEWANVEWEKVLWGKVLRGNSVGKCTMGKCLMGFCEYPNPNNHPKCTESHCVKLSGKRGSVVLKISDTCYGCKPYDVDVSDRVFPLLDDPNKGRVVMTWKWVDCRKNPPGKLKNKERP
jgi:hypothetical protein